MIRITGTRQSSPKAKRRVRKVNGGAYCSPIFVAMKPEPQTVTKYQASSALKLRPWKKALFTSRLAAHAVAALFLGAVERTVRCLDHRLGRGESVVPLRYADADRDGHRIPAPPAAALALAAFALLRSIG